MKETAWLIGTILSLLLAGLGVFLGSSNTYGILLLALAAAGIVGIAGTALWRTLPQVYITQDRAFRAAKSIYDGASRFGGEILATHIFPKHAGDTPDLATTELAKASHQVDIQFNRILFRPAANGGAL